MGSGLRVEGWRIRAETVNIECVYEMRLFGYEILGDIFLL